MMKNKHGGPRPGAGRKRGKDWRKNGQHENKVYTNIGFELENYHWLKAEAKEHGISMAALVNEAITIARIQATE